MPYAEIVVNSPARRVTSTYHYYVPADFTVEVGHLLWVPFGVRQMQGLVVALLDYSDVEETRDILGFVDPTPVLSPAQVELARWIAEYYRCSLAEAVELMLPGGMRQRSLPTIEIKPGMSPPADLTERQSKLVSYLLQSGRTRTQKASRTVDIPGFATVVSQLVRRGVLARGWELERPRVRPRVEKTARARMEFGTAAEMLSEVQRASRQRLVLEYLLERQARPAEGATAGPAGVPIEELYAETGCAASVLKALVDKGLVEIVEVEVWRDPLANRRFTSASQVKLTEVQTHAWSAIAASLRDPEHQTFLLHGVTGSGKTEIYVRALEETLRRGQQGIIMVPEIALTPQTVHRFASHFPGRIAVWHSRLSPGERFDEWRRIRDGELDVVIGSRSAVFAPLRKLGLVVVDEEHEWSYKHEKTPRYQGRDVAIRLAELTRAKVILGTATPDVVTYHRALSGQYRLLELRERVEAPAETGQGNGPPEPIKPDLARGPVPRPYPRGEAPPVPPLPPGEAGAAAGRRVRAPGDQDARLAPDLGILPPVHVVDMRQELRAGNRGIFSRALREAIGLALSLREQVILFLNRRGASTFVMCRDCGFVLGCRRCGVPLVYHSAEDDLVCHQCNYRTFTPDGCPNCWGSRIKFFGVGTQKVEEETSRLFPEARVLRWDSDVVKGPASHEELLARFRAHEADVLIGTQMIAKGLDLPLVTLVGVVSADTILHLPDFRAGERTFQLLTQVAGRAGRGALGGRVIVQTYSTEHYCIQAASRHDYYGFYQQEIEFRQRNGYPPFGKLAKLVYQHTNDGRAQQEAEKMAAVLRQAIDRLGLAGADIIGPAPGYLRRRRGKYRWQVIIRGGQISELLNSVPIPYGWTVDVDPLTTL